MLTITTGISNFCDLNSTYQHIIINSIYFINHSMYLIIIYLLQRLNLIHLLCSNILSQKTANLCR